MNSEETYTTIPFYEALNKLGEIVETGYISPRLLKLAKTNNRTVKIPDSDRDEMVTSVRESGVVEPIIINLNNEVVSGQLRWNAALIANLESIPFTRIKFIDAFSERICSMMQDELHHKLDSYDKYMFVKKCIEEDKKTISQISKLLGKNTETIRAWSRFQSVPEVISNNEDASDTFLSLVNKKKVAVRSILDKPQYKNDVEKSLKLIEFASDAPLRELEQAKKDANSGSPIDTEARKKRLKERTTLIEVKIPKYLDKTFRNKLKEVNADYVVVIEKLIAGYVRGEFIIENIE
jgi:hypothetical protein